MMTQKAHIYNRLLKGQVATPPGLKSPVIVPPNHLPKNGWKLFASSRRLRLAARQKTN